MKNMIFGGKYKNNLFTPAQVVELSEKAKREVAKQGADKTWRRRRAEDVLLAKSMGLTLDEIL